MQRDSYRPSGQQPSRAAILPAKLPVKLPDRSMKQPSQVSNGQSSYHNANTGVTFNFGKFDQTVFNPDGSFTSFSNNGDRTEFKKDGSFVTWSKGGDRTEFKNDGSFTTWTKRGDRSDFKVDGGLTMLSTSATGAQQGQPQETYAQLKSKYDARGWKIQSHERRFKDCNELLQKMKRRLDPADRTTIEVLNKAVWNRIKHKSKQAFSENPHMQSYYDFVHAYDHLHSAKNTPAALMAPPASALAASPAGASFPQLLTGDKRIASMTATIKIQGSLIQEQIEKIASLESQLAAANAGLKRPLVDPSPTDFMLEKHSSLTFNGFSQQNAMNPARLQMLNSASPRSAGPPQNIAKMMPKGTGANTAPLVSDRRRYDSASQRSRASSTVADSGKTPVYTGSPANKQAGYSRSVWPIGAGVDTVMRDASEPTERSDVGSKRAMPFLDYDDAPSGRRESPNKRIKSGALTPPLPEDLVIGPHVVKVAEEVADSPGGACVKQEGVEFAESAGGACAKQGLVDLEMGEIVDSGLQTAADTATDAGTGPEGDHKYAYEDLDEMISQAQTKAIAE